MKKNLTHIKLLVATVAALLFSKATFAQVEVIVDGGFEGGSPSAAWTEASTNFGTPLCTVAGCGTGTGTGPATGTWWAWFGGLPSALEEGSMTQNVTIPVGTSANLSFKLEQITCDDPGDFLEVTVDGNVVFTTDGSSPLCGVLGYSTQNVDLLAYADGNSHVLQFHSITTSPNGTATNIFVDDVSLLVTTGGGGTPCSSIIPFNPSLVIPDDDPLGASDIQAVSTAPGTTLGTDVKLAQVCFEATHTWVGDLIVTLTAPNGASVILMDRPGEPATTVGCGGDNVNVCISPGVGNEMENVCGNLPAIVGVFTAANGLDLDAINAAGGSPNGNWTLSVSDNAAADEGTIDAWSLVFDIGTNVSAAWTPSADSLCATSTPVNLDALVTGTAGGTWSGQGVTGSQFDPTGLSGIVDINYSVNDAIAGCDKSESHNIFIVASTPVCSFTASIANTTVSTTNTTTGAESYEWDFGDGSATDNSFNPSHSYATNGTYTITLSTTNICGTVTCTQDVTIAGCPDLILDGGFEVGSPSVAWTEASTNFGTPLCTTAACGVGGGTGPYNGSTWWAWFGGIPATLEDASMSQTIVIPTGTTTNLYFQFEVPNCDDPGDVFDIIIDGTDTIFHSSGDAATNPLCGVVGYVLQTINLTAYADGNAHLLDLHGVTTSPNGNVTNFMVDDVSVLSCPTGIVETAIANEISVQPVPATQFITLTLKGINADNVKISIYDVQGKSVYVGSTTKSTGDFSQQIDVSKWNNGVYVLNIEANGKSITRNIVKQ